MDDFLEWVFDTGTPFYITVMFIVATAISLVAAVIVSVVAIAAGYWIVPVVILIVLPIYMVVKMYLESNK